ncbi:MAG: hypothetical protein ACUZ8I_00730 [Candidatus Scalindua sp.]
MNKSISIITLSIILLLSTSTFADKAKWYEGGNLHKATVRTWNNASYRNRLATSADWFNEITKTSNPELKKKLDNLNYNQWLVALKAFSKELEICVSEMVADERLFSPNDQIAEVAAICYISMYMDSKSEK